MKEKTVLEKIERLKEKLRYYEEIARELNVSVQTIYRWRKGKSPQRYLKIAIDRLYKRKTEQIIKEFTNEENH
ncbi:MAG: helix-turn-helix domain-containing protein [Bacteroidetes bacterium]|nr:helix-turn-helix domain-containing protein [Bacteroidota bacterium]